MAHSIAASWSDDGVPFESLLLDRGAAERSLASGAVDPATSRCAFVQVFEKMHRHPTLLRKKHDAQGKLFEVSSSGMPRCLGKGVLR